MKCFRSGWGKYYYSSPLQFLGTDKNDEDCLKFPGMNNSKKYEYVFTSLGFGKSGIDWLIANTSFVGIGVDTLSIELGRTQECYVHRTLTSGNRVGVTGEI